MVEPLNLQISTTLRASPEALRHLLTSTLALYVLKNSKRPASSVISSLMDMEIKAAQLVGMIVQMQANGIAGPKLEGTLAGICSFIPNAITKRAEESRGATGKP